MAVCISAEYLNKAALRGDHETLETAHKQGTDTDSSDALGFTPLMAAAMFGHSHVVQLLIDLGSRVEACDTWGNTPLIRAAQEGRSDTVAVLLEKGANPHVRDKCERRTPLMYAAMRGHCDVVIQLLRYGSDVSITDIQGRDAYKLAKRNKHGKIGDIIKSHKDISFDITESNNVQSFLDTDATLLKSSENRTIPSPELQSQSIVRPQFNWDKSNNTDHLMSEVYELRSRVNFLEEKVAVLSYNVEDQNDMLRQFIQMQGHTVSCITNNQEGLLSDTVLCKLSENIGAEWSTLGFSLGFSRQKLDQLRADNQFSLQSTIIAMLQVWRDAQDCEESTKVQQLNEAFHKLQRFDLLDILKSLTEERMQMSIE